MGSKAGAEKARRAEADAEAVGLGLRQREQAVSGRVPDVRAGKPVHANVRNVRWGVPGKYAVASLCGRFTVCWDDSKRTYLAWRVRRKPDGSIIPGAGTILKAGSREEVLEAIERVAQE
jgi:hypothetical protein